MWLTIPLATNECVSGTVKSYTIASDNSNELIESKIKFSCNWFTYSSSNPSNTSNPRSYDERAITELKLQRYENTDFDIDEKHYKDIKHFISYLEKNPEEHGLFKNILFILSPDSEGDLYWHYTHDLSIDSPYEETGLSEFVHLHNKHPVWEGYKKNLSASYHNKFVSFLKKLGALSKLEVDRAFTVYNPHRDHLWQDWIKRSAKQTHTGIDSDYSITHLEKYLMAQSLKRLTLF